MGGAKFGSRPIAGRKPPWSAGPLTDPLLSPWIPAARLRGDMFREDDVQTWPGIVPRRAAVRTDTNGERSRPSVAGERWEERQEREDGLADHVHRVVRGLPDPYQA